MSYLLTKPFRKIVRTVRDRAAPKAIVRTCHRIAENIADLPLSAVTFDYGYADNLKVAAPLLRKCGIPATVCLATATIIRTRDSTLETGTGKCSGKRLQNSRSFIRVESAGPAVKQGNQYWFMRKGNG
jgi:hypothetical protein